MNQKIKTYSALALATAAVMPLACKKDDPEANDPNIDDKSWNKVITAELTDPNQYEGIDSIDLNSDGIYDFIFVIGKGTATGDTYNYFAMYGTNTDNEVLAESISGYPFMKTFASDTEINSGLVTWNNVGYGAYFSEYYTLDIGNIKAGSGDKLVGFRFKVSGNTHYGWAKLNYAADKSSITIKETGYNKTAGSAISAGSK